MTINIFWGWCVYHITRFRKIYADFGAGQILHHLISERDVLLYYPPSPTHCPENGETPSTLELLLVRGNIQLSEPTTYTDLSSDPLPVQCEVHLTATRQTTATTITDYDNAN